MDAILTVNEAQQITLFNAAAERMFGYSAEMILGQPLERLIPARFHSTHPGHMQRFRATGASPRTMGGPAGTQWGQRSTGEEFPIEASISQFEVNGQNFYTAIVRDVTERHHALEELAASRAQLAGIIASATDAIITVNAKQHITLYNSAAERMFGYRPDAILGQSLDLLIPERFAAIQQAYLERFGETGEATRSLSGLTELTARRLSGEEFPVEAAISQVDLDGNKFYTIILRDMSARDQAASALRESEMRYRRILETSHEGIWVVDASQQTTYVNPRMAKMLDYSVVEMLGLPLSEFMFKNDVPLARNHIQEQRPDVQTFQTDQRFMRRDGSTQFCHVAASAITDEDGNFLGSLAMCMDITNRRLTEEALRESQLQYKRIVETSMEGIWLVDADQLTTYINPRMAAMLGYQSSEMLGHPLAEFVEPQSFQIAMENIEEQRIEGTVQQLDFQFRHKEGGLVDVIVATSALADEDGKYLGSMAMCMDITERKRSEDALRQSQAFLQEAQQMGKIGNWTLDLSDWKTTWSDQTTRMWGLDPATVVPSYQLFLDSLHLDDYERIKATAEGTVESGVASEMEYRIIWPDGSVHWMNGRTEVGRDSSGKPIRLHGINLDITERVVAEEERKRLEGQFLQAQKMEAIGTLAGGIAHDFNNILAGIQGFGELVLDKLDPTSAEFSDQQEVLRAADRAGQLVRQILTFSRKINSQRVPVNLPSIINEVCALLRATLPSTIEIKRMIDEPEALVIADPVEIHQILVNLCTNAGHAMQVRGGVLGISLRRHSIEDAGLLGADLEVGDYFLLSVSDTGAGIAPEIAERIFEPFYTTKEAGEGTGLGLSTVHGVVKSLGGKVSVYSELGEGTVFNVYLPASQSARVEDVVSEVVPGNGRVLFVDDEPSLARLGKQLLENLGYTVVSLTNSLEALELFRATPNDFDILVSDQTMPKLKGSELARLIAEIRPDLPVLLCSGFGQDLQDNPPSIKAVLHKPVSRAELSHAIREALGAAHLIG